MKYLKKILVCASLIFSMTVQILPAVKAENVNAGSEDIFSTDNLLFNTADYKNAESIGWELPNGSIFADDMLDVGSGKVKMRGYGSTGDFVGLEFKMEGSSIFSDIALYDVRGNAAAGFTYGRKTSDDGFWAGHGERSHGGVLTDQYGINRFSNYLKTEVAVNSAYENTGRFVYETDTVCRIQIENANGTVENVLHNANMGNSYTGDYYTVTYFKDNKLISTEYYSGARYGIALIAGTNESKYKNLKIYGVKNEAMDKLYQDLRELTLPEKVNENITLPTEGKNGSTIVWNSDKPHVIASDGTYNQPMSGNTVVTLTAKLSAGENMLEKKFTVTAEYAKAENVVTLENVSTADVTISDDFLLNAQQKDIDYLFSLEPERFLYNWYITSGLKPATDSGYENSWERTEESNFRGHMFGHYMSALAQAYNAEKNDDVKVRLLEKIKASVNGIVKCQEGYAKKYPSRAGYASPFSEYWLNELDNVDSGSEAWNKKESNNPHTLVPWYNLHKVVAGLIDVYKYVGDDEIGETAFQSVQDFVDYLYNCRISKYSEAQKANMLKIEYGGMGEALFELYNLTGKASYKECADGFMENTLFEQLAADNDVLSGKHANTTIPKLIGALKKYTVLTQNEEYYKALTNEEKDGLEMYLKASENFFDIVLEGHSYVTGGNSVAEHFRAADTISAYYNHPETHETCNEYNMLKLARELFKLTNDKKYSDYYEKTFINAILASQNPETGEMTYFQPMGAGYSKVYNKERFWCCTGTGTENFTKLGDSIYFKKDERVYVNMYFNSVLEYAERNLKLAVSANIPNSDEVAVTVSGIDESDVTDGTDLYIRIPEWCAGTPIVKYNGTEITELKLSGGYAVIESVKNGDNLDLKFPMTVSVEELDDNENIVAFKYGPTVLAARMGQNNVGQSAATGIMVLKAVIDSSLPTSIILNSTSAEEWKDNISENLVRIEDTDDGFVQFKINGTMLDENITFVPYYSIYNYRYGVYMSLAPMDSAEMTEKILSDKQSLRNEEAASASLMQIDGNNYEATYNVKMSVDSSVGSYNGRNYRDAQKNGWFSYDLPIVVGEQNYLNTVYTKDDNGRSFEILINDKSFVTEKISSDGVTSANGFYTKTREIPSEYTSGAGVAYKEINGEQTACVTVKFKSNGGFVGGLYGISVTQRFDTNPKLSGLTFDDGIMMPVFDGDVAEYTLYVSQDAQTVGMKAVPIKASGLVYDGGILIDDTQVRKIDVSERDKITLTSYAQDHETKTEYIVSIVKSESEISKIEIEDSTVKDNKLTYTLKLPKTDGVLIGALYDDEDILFDVKICDAQNNVEFDVPSGKTSGSVKFMQWESAESAKPVAISLNEKWSVD